MAAPLRVAVAGASGIGKHHAKWHHLAGAEVVGFLGSNQSSCAATARALAAIFPFAGRGYWDLGQLLDHERPDVIDVCLPAESHFDCARQALAAGCHVLCEKPLVWQVGVPAQVLLERSRELVETARQRGLRFGVCTQYAASQPQYLRLYQAVRGPVGPVSSFYAEMETLGRGRNRDAEAVWMDMGAHPLSLLLGWLPGGQIFPDSLQIDFSGTTARAVFDFQTGQTRCHSELVVRDLESGPLARRFGVQGFVADCEGRPDSTGQYRSVLRHGRTEEVGEDFMSRLIAQFDAAVQDPDQALLVPGEVGLRNLELQLCILSQARVAR